MPPMPTKRDGCAAAAIGNDIYVVGGYDGRTRLNTVEVYNVKTRQWKSITPMGVRRDGCCCDVVADRLFVFGGYDGRSWLNTVECYDPSTQSWRKIAPMPTKRSYCACVAIDATNMAPTAAVPALQSSHSAPSTTTHATVVNRRQSIGNGTNNAVITSAAGGQDGYAAAYYDASSYAQADGTNTGAVAQGHYEADGRGGWIWVPLVVPAQQQTFHGYSSSVASHHSQPIPMPSGYHHHDHHGNGSLTGSARNSPTNPGALIAMHPDLLAEIPPSHYSPPSGGMGHHHHRGGSVSITGGWHPHQPDDSPPVSSVSHSLIDSNGNGGNGGNVPVIISHIHHSHSAPSLYNNVGNESPAIHGMPPPTNRSPPSPLSPVSPSADTNNGNGNGNASSNKQ